jgi:UDP-N-acetylmuramate--alanine ligase
MDIYPARELPIDGVSSKMILDKVKLQEKTLANKDNLMEIIANKKIDVLVTFGAGDIDRFTDMIEKQLKEQYNV